MNELSLAPAKKRCSCCWQFKPLTDFRRDTHQSFGLKRVCTLCVALRYKLHALGKRDMWRALLDTLRQHPGAVPKPISKKVLKAIRARDKALGLPTLPADPVAISAQATLDALRAQTHSERYPHVPIYKLRPVARICTSCGCARLPHSYAGYSTECLECQSRAPQRKAREQHRLLLLARRAATRELPERVKCNSCGKQRAGTIFGYIKGTTQRKTICNMCIRGPSKGGRPREPRPVVVETKPARPFGPTARSRALLLRQRHTTNRGT